MKKNEEKKQKDKKVRWQSILYAASGVATTLSFIALMDPKRPVGSGE